MSRWIPHNLPEGYWDAELSERITVRYRAYYARHAERRCAYYARAGKLTLAEQWRNEANRFRVAIGWPSLGHLVSEELRAWRESGQAERDGWIAQGTARPATR